MKSLKFILSGLLIVPATLFFPFLNSARAASCNDVIFVFARGSGEALNDVSYQEFKTKIEENIPDDTLKYDFYELGSEMQGDYQYPAIAIGIDTVEHTITTIGAAAGAGGSYAFGESVKAGKEELSAYINSINTTCENTKFVLAGYSQGGLVVSTALQDIDSSKIIYAATLGDPKLYLPEGYGLFPNACRGENLSEYRTFVPDCRAYEGLLGKNDPYRPTSFSGKLGAWCNYLDIMCSRHFYIFDPLQGHISYISDGLYEKLAKIINNRLADTFPDKITKVEIDAPVHDVAVLIDSTGSMSGLIDQYKSEGIRLAQEAINSGGRIALYEYRDLDDPFEPVRHCGFDTCTIETFVEKINSITVSGGGDTLESAMSAALKALNTENWKPGATKSIVILTDAGYHQVDRDGTTPEQVIERSLEIDPVNFYIITTPSNIENYTSLAEATGGETFSSTDEIELSTTHILERPTAILNNAEYQGIIGDKLTFDASSSAATSKIIRYEWDLDGDGAFETSSENPIISKIYTAPVSGFVQVKVVDENNLSSTMSASISITEESPISASTITVESTIENGNDLTINYSTDAEKVFLILNDALLGELTEKTFTITDLDLTRENTISLVSYSANGERGETKSLTLGSEIQNNKNNPVKAPDSGIVKTTSNLDASGRQTHTYKRQDS
ncbi:cutinase family protein [Candidatus Saccharibacteria bacterium]|nr:cutinase family protein [Candidatus Saccharibacteria bacterium]